MHILESYFEIGGYDFKLIKGGISVYAWNLAVKFAERGHKVSILTAAHGQIDYLQRRYDAVPLPYVDSYRLPLTLDPKIWTRLPQQLELPLTTRAYSMSLDGIDVYYLSNAYLDLYSQSFYPPYEAKGHDLGFFKPLVFQIDCIRFIRSFFADERMIVHLHEPYYHYLMPAALQDLPNKTVVSTVQSNMPINKKIYRPKVERLFKFLDTDVDLQDFMDTRDDTDHFVRCMENYTPRTHLHYSYGMDYVTLYSLVVAYSDLIDFLSPGQQRFYSMFQGTPFERLFERLTVARVVKANAHKQFVGWCGISPAWLKAERGLVDRVRVLGRLGLDPALITFYHNARYAPHHKGQVELMRSIDQVLSEGQRANFIVRCISGTGIDNPYFHAVQARFAKNFHLDWKNISEVTLIDYASASDFCIFPSKFEMDTFLIAQGEAMLCGAVPIATAQEGMSHFNHTLPLDHPQATGFAVPRSFREDDALLVDALANQIREAITLYRDERPTYDRLAANARCIAERFTWDFAAETHLAAFAKADEEAALSSREEIAPVHDSFDRCKARMLRYDQAAPTEAVLGLSDVERSLHRRQSDQDTRRGLFAAALARAEFKMCTELAEEFDDDAMRRQLAERCHLVPDNGGLGISYCLPNARQIDLFVADEANGFRSTPMAVADSGFHVKLDRLPENKEFYFLITLNDGRVTWDVIRHECHPS